MGITINVQINSAKSIIGKRGLEPFGRVQKLIDSECLRLNEKYMRIDTGANIKSGMASNIGSGEIRYTMHYSVYDYYPTRTSHGVGTSKGALRGDYHFIRMVAANRTAILKSAAAAAGGKAEP